jgi:hypothetical protein
MASEPRPRMPFYWRPATQRMTTASVWSVYVVRIALGVALLAALFATWHRTELRNDAWFVPCIVAIFWTVLIIPTVEQHGDGTSTSSVPDHNNTE